MLSSEKPNEILQVHTDHLGTPRAVSDKDKTVLWRLEGDQFGDVAPQVATITMPLRHAGQYFDSESGLFYNYFRFYNPATGRYIENDPIGLDGGLNRWGYVGASPLSFVDEYGLNANLVRPFRYTRNRGFGFGIRPLRWNTPAENARWIQQQRINFERQQIAIRMAQRRADAERSCICDAELPEYNGTPTFFVDRPLLRNKYGNPVPESGIFAPHTQLGCRTGRNGTYPQAREFDINGNPIRDIDFTNHGRSDHPNPHQHIYLPNSTGGTPKRGSPEPLQYP